MPLTAGVPDPDPLHTATRPGLTIVVSQKNQVSTRRSPRLARALLLQR